MKPEPIQILRSATNILLVDWPDPSVPRALLEAGFAVFGFSPDGYTSVKLVSEPATGQSSLIPDNDSEKGYLVFQKLNSAPDFIDIVNIYRPEEEYAAIIEKHALPLKAKVVWLHPPVTSALTRIMAAENSLAFIDGVNIVDAANTMKK